MHLAHKHAPRQVWVSRFRFMVEELFSCRAWSYRIDRAMTPKAMRPNGHMPYTYLIITRKLIPEFKSGHEGTQ